MEILHDRVLDISDVPDEDQLVLECNEMLKATINTENEKSQNFFIQSDDDDNAEGDDDDDDDDSHEMTL